MNESTNTDYLHFYLSQYLGQGELCFNNLTDNMRFNSIMQSEDLFKEADEENIKWYQARAKRKKKSFKKL